MLKFYFIHEQTHHQHKMINNPYANLIDLEGFILVMIYDGMINIKKHKINVPIFKSIIAVIAKTYLKQFIFFILLIFLLELIQTTFFLNHKISFFQGEKCELLCPLHQ